MVKFGWITYIANETKLLSSIVVTMDGTLITAVTGRMHRWYAYEVCFFIWYNFWLDGKSNNFSDNLFCRCAENFILLVLTEGYVVLPWKLLPTNHKNFAALTVPSLLIDLFLVKKSKKQNKTKQENKNKKGRTRNHVPR